VGAHSILVVSPAASVLADVASAGRVFGPEGAVAVPLAVPPLALVDGAASVPVHAPAVAQVAVPLAHVVVARAPVHAHPVPFLACNPVQVARVVYLAFWITMLGDRAQLRTRFHLLTPH
jgi:hypothetical protein